jgi:hypothetical protein
MLIFIRAETYVNRVTESRKADGPDLACVSRGKIIILNELGDIDALAMESFQKIILDTVPLRYYAHNILVLYLFSFREFLNQSCLSS